MRDGRRWAKQTQQMHMTVCERVREGRWGLGWAARMGNKREREREGEEREGQRGTTKERRNAHIRVEVKQITLACGERGKHWGWVKEE